MTAVALGAAARRQAVVKALTDAADVQALTRSPYVVAREQLERQRLPIVTVFVVPGQGPFGWAGGLLERYTIDVWVDEEDLAELGQGVADDPLTTADRLQDAIDAALVPAVLRAALAGLVPAVTDVGIVAARVAEWSDVPEPGPSGTVHKTADYEVQFSRLTT